MPEEPDLSEPSPEDPTQMMTPPSRGGSILPSARVPLREVIGDFEVIEKLGAGGMGAVYRARQVSLERQVALKVLPGHMIEDAESVGRFQREARVAGSLSHANLVKVYAAGEAAGVHYIAMELIEGEDLGRRLKREGKLPPAEALRICAEVARGLEYAWRTAQLIHRDIKPANIFLAAGGAVKVGDLGLAKSVLGNTTGLTQSGTMMGTPHYISPEQARADKELDFRADIYSLGCTLYQMLTGQVPYSGTDAITVIRQHLDAPLPAILKVWPQCPIPLARLVGKMLKKTRHERHASYEELIGQMESVWAQIDPAGFAPESYAPPSRVEAEATPRPGDGDGHRPPRQTPKSPLPLYGGIAAGVVALAVAAFAFWPKEEKLTKAQIMAAEREAAEQARASEPAGGRRAVAAPTSGRAGVAPAGGDSAPPSSATKDAPFVNSLGMKFVPVPIVGGPTGGQRVLFGVWAVRVQDFEVFARETKFDWKRATDVEQGPEYPAVHVSWEDATAFCAWLTERERKAGKLGANEVYRLPSDHEWSCAVGIGEREDAGKLPSEKHQKMADEFPWGSAWPPPEKAGNYWSEELRPLLAAGKFSWIKGELPGYHDGFATTSPVGSFPANRFGLYDMGGNVWQWCEDWFDASHKDRVLRGAAWNDNDRGYLLSSLRALNVPGSRYGTYGFRCVVGVSAR